MRTGDCTTLCEPASPRRSTAWQLIPDLPERPGSPAATTIGSASVTTGSCTPSTTRSTWCSSRESLIAARSTAGRGSAPRWTDDWHPTRSPRLRADRSALDPCDRRFERTGHRTGERGPRQHSAPALAAGDRGVTHPVPAGGLSERLPVRVRVVDAPGGKPLLFRAVRIHRVDGRLPTAHADENDALPVRRPRGPRVCPLLSCEPPEAASIGADRVDVGPTSIPSHEQRARRRRVTSRPSSHARSKRRLRDVRWERQLAPIAAVRVHQPDLIDAGYPRCGWSARRQSSCRQATRLVVPRGYGSDAGNRAVDVDDRESECSGRATA